MTGASRPWWASPDAAAGLDDVDPVDAFRSARRRDDPDGTPPWVGAAGPGANGTAGTAGTGSPDRELPPAGPHRPELCGICPLCSLARSLEETRPELVEHLTEAARHLAAALRALVEPPDGPPAPEASERVQRIDLDPDETEHPVHDDGEGP